MKQRDPINRHRKPGPKQLPARYRRLRKAEAREEDSEVDLRDDPWTREARRRDAEYLAECAEAVAVNRAWQQMLGEDWFRVPLLDQSIAVPAKVSPPADEKEATEVDRVYIRPSNESVIQFLVEHNERTCRLPCEVMDELSRRNRDDSIAFRELVTHHARIKGPVSHSGSLAMILELSRLWIRPVRSWSRPDPGAPDWIESLAEHLLVEHPVPPCLRGIWNTQHPSEAPAPKYRSWFVLLGRGISLQKAAAAFMWHIPNRFVHWLHQAPEQLSLTEAIVWAEVMRLGGSRVEFRRLRRQPALAVDLTWNHERMRAYRDFFKTTVQWLVRHRDELTESMCDVVLDWRVHLLTEQRPLVALPWRGISGRRAFERASAYERERKRPYVECSWPKRGWDWRVRGLDGAQWAIHELTTGRELFEEGKALRHCVGSYANHCVVGCSTVFSLQADGKRRLTVEVNPSSRAVVQARGQANRPATPEEQEILARWRQEVLLAVSGECFP